VIYQQTDGNPLFVAAAGINEEPRIVEDRCAELARRGQFLMAVGIEEWPDGTIAGRYRFVHALYQHVVYERLSPGRRAQFHRRIGARAEAGYRKRAGERAAELARHFREGREAPRAVTYVRQAAENALQRSAYHESSAHLLQGSNSYRHCRTRRSATATSSPCGSRSARC
jgi:predicted ATPase